MHKSKSKLPIVSVIATVSVFVIQLLEYQNIVSTIKEMNIQVSESLLTPIIVLGILIVTAINIMINYNILKVIFQLANKAIASRELYQVFIISMMVSLPIQRIIAYFIVNTLLVAVLNPLLNLSVLIITFKCKRNDDEYLKPVVIYGTLQLCLSVLMNVASGIHV